MKVDFKTLAIRALNHWRVTYQPSYLGLRLLLQQIPKATFSQYLQEYILYKLPLRTEYRYRKYLRFKEPGENLKYRDMLAVSPSSALAEAYTLRILETIPSLKDKPNVYSYQWPSSAKSGQSYSYFFSGYKDRNDLVTKKFKDHPGYSLIAYDIKNFYPMIRKEVVGNRLIKHFSSSPKNVPIEFAVTNCNQILSIPIPGIPIGPALAHVFGNIALEDVDKEMSSTFGDNYLRYVDDIYFIVEKTDIKKTEDKLYSLLSKEGLALHEKKYDCLSASDWIGNVASIQEQICHNQFDKLFKRIELYFWRTPSNKSIFQNLCRTHGVPIPIEKLALKASYGRFQRYIRGIITHTPQLNELLSKIRNESESVLLQDALNLNKYYFKTIKDIPSPADTTHIVVRKWRVQRIRSMLNRMLYLNPIQDYGRLLEIIPEVDEFYEHRRLIQALITKSLSPIISIPGPVTNTFASIIRDLNYGPVELDPGDLNKEGIFDSICTFSTYGIVDLPKDWIEKLPIKNQELLKFCQFSKSDFRIITDQLYEDELRSLQLGESEDTLHNIITTRFCDQENVELEALLIDKYGI